MKTHHLLGACLLTTLGATAVQAQTMMYPSDAGYYGEITYTPIELKADVGETSKPEAIRFIVGKALHKNWAIEAMYTTTFAKDHMVGFDGDVTNYGISLKPKMALTDNTELFARLGVTHSNITAAAGNHRSSGDFSYGVGVQTKFTSTVYGQLDYMHYQHKDGIRAQGYGISVGYRF